MLQTRGRISGVREAVKTPGPAGAVDDALHDVAQPLTAMLFVLQMALLQGSPEVWRKAVETSLEECHRAVERLESARAVTAQWVTQAELSGGEGWGVL
jgi:hypothetical protein